MKIIKTIFILLAVTLSGNIISGFIGGIIPGSVIGMIILFIILISGVVKTDTIQETSLYLVSHLSLFILPGAISVMKMRGFSAWDIFLFSAVAAVSTLLTLTVTAVVTEFLLKITGENEIG